MRTLLALLISLSLAACGKPWNNPYPRGEEGLNILYSSFSEQPKHLDPARSYSSNEYAFIAQIYEPPLQYHFLKRPYELVPLTAAEVPRPQLLDAQGNPLPENADPAAVAFSEYEIRIQPGIRYQPHPAFALKPDGMPRYLELGEKDLAGIHSLKDFPESGTRELTAADYVYQIKRLAQPGTHSPIAGLMAEHILGFSDFTKRIAEEERRLQQKPFLDLRPFEMTGVREIDRYRFLIRLKGIYPQFVYWLAMPFFAPLPWEVVRFYGQPGMEERNISLDWYPVGTGPFLLAENNPNLRMVLERNPNFHGEAYPSEGELDDHELGVLADAGKPLPLIDKAVYSLEKEDIPYWNKFLQGYYDTSGITSDSFDQAVRFGGEGEARLTDAMQSKGINLTTAVTSSIMYLGFNMKDAVVGGDSERARLLRRAISIAVDYEEYIAIFANGRGLTAQGPLPPGIFGYRKDDYNPHLFEKKEGRLKRRSLAEAKGLLAQAGYKDAIDSATGKPLVLYFDVAAAGPDDKARLSWLRKQFDKLGIQLILRTTDYNRFQEKMQKGTGQMFWWGWNADYPDPENFLFLLYGPNGKMEQGGENAANYANPEFDALFDRMKNMPNGPERQAAINRMTEILRHDAPWIWGFFPKGFSLHHAWYHNVKPNLMANNTLKYKRIDPGKRRESRLQWNEPLWWPLILTLLALAALFIPALRLHRQRERSSAR
ncbi:MAG: ABC transporter substrate-binding protein [Gammaproteobacteria bacterium]|nr:ABC transporter substrate-binding protein [Gammaproteobacteria bacterium]MBU1655482.1 ABC transporter substrate-binding protein [Gammaproteobacteria bacterium]MBU1960389.1 ABC transporter substrate-binding protein [Gammaproteobacteria bacterium]